MALCSHTKNKHLSVVRKLGDPLLRDPTVRKPAHLDPLTPHVHLRPPISGNCGVPESQFSTHKYVACPRYRRCVAAVAHPLNAQSCPSPLRRLPHWEAQYPKKNSREHRCLKLGI
jgi:hypothetical protein